MPQSDLIKVLYNYFIYVMIIQAGYPFWKSVESHRLEIKPGTSPEKRVWEASIFEVVGVEPVDSLHLSAGWRERFHSFVYLCCLSCNSPGNTYLFFYWILPIFLKDIHFQMRQILYIYSDNWRNFIGTSRALPYLSTGTPTAQ